MLSFPFLFVVWLPPPPAPSARYDQNWLTMDAKRACWQELPWTGIKTERIICCTSSPIAFRVLCWRLSIYFGVHSYVLQHLAQPSLARSRVLALYKRKLSGGEKAAIQFCQKIYPISLSKEARKQKNLSNFPSTSSFSNIIKLFRNHPFSKKSFADFAQILQMNERERRESAYMWREANHHFERGHILSMAIA